MYTSVKICCSQLLLLTLLVLPSGWVLAQEDGAGAVENASMSPLVAEGDALIERVDGLKKKISKWQQIFQHASGEDRAVAATQITRQETELRHTLDALIKHFAQRRSEGLASEALQNSLAHLVEEESQRVQEQIKRAQAAVAELRTGREALAPSELLAREQLLTEANKELNQLLKALLSNSERQVTLQLNAEAPLAALDSLLTERADMLAGRVEFVQQQLTQLAKRLAKAAKGDQEALETQRRAFLEKKRNATSSLAAVLALMDKRAIETSDYSQLLIKATGEISGETLDTKVLVGLSQQWLDSAKVWLVEYGPGIVVKVLVFIGILLVFKVLSGFVGRVARKAIKASKVALSQLLQEFFISLSAKVVMLIGFLIAISQLGIEIGPLLAGLGVVGFIVGFALQDTLSNFASGLMILIYRPYDVGDVIEAGGVMGKVDQMSLVSTTILTFDNQKLVIPNSKIWGDVIRNVTAQDSRRVDMVFGIGYADDHDKAERVLRDIIAQHPLVLAQPEPVIKLHTLGESSVDFIVRPWARTSDYWAVYWDVTRTVKLRFDAEEISIPFPQRDVHIYNALPKAT